MAKKQSPRRLFVWPRLHPAPFIGVLTTLLVLGFFNAQLITARVLAQIAPPAPIAIEQIEQPTADEPVDMRPRIVVPAVGVDAPVTYGMTSVQDTDVQRALEHGVLHFGGAPLPGQPGNAVYVGHSSNQPWSPGDYKFVFILLDKLQEKDLIYLYYEGVRYAYEVTGKKVVKPADVSVLEGSTHPIATFITCTPLGTNLNRLVVSAKLVDPAPNVETIDGLTRSAPELNGALPGQGYSTIESFR
jgi:LPXTG-site transpeptidase (sortase) family protein